MYSESETCAVLFPLVGIIDYIGRLGARQLEHQAGGAIDVGCSQFLAVKGVDVQVGHVGEQLLAVHEQLALELAEQFSGDDHLGAPVVHVALLVAHEDEDDDAAPLVPSALAVAPSVVHGGVGAAEEIALAAQLGQHALQCRDARTCTEVEAVLLCQLIRLGQVS